MSSKPTIQKIQSVSKFFRVLFQFLLVFLPVIFVIEWMHAPRGIVTPFGMLTPIPEGYTNIDSHVPILHVLTTKEYVLALLLSLIPFLLDLFIIERLIKIFRLFEQGQIFSLSHVSYIKNIGYAMLMIQIFNPFYQLIMGAVLTLGNPPGHRFMSIGFGSSDIGFILIGFMMILISWVMSEGCKLHDEMQLTV